MKRTRLIVITILVISVGSIIGYFVYAATQENFWEGLSCEEMFDFAMSPEHQDLTMEQHMEFHKDYDPCIQNP
jgi:hypothetical protein